MRFREIRENPEKRIEDITRHAKSRLNSPAMSKLLDMYFDELVATARTNNPAMNMAAKLNIEGMTIDNLPDEIGIPDNGSQILWYKHGSGHYAIREDRRPDGGVIYTPAPDAVY